MTAQERSLLRFAADLPALDELVTLGEGDTPLLPLNALAKHLRLEQLSAKMESQNPTGSYKDRVAAVSLSLARQRGNKGWLASSSGNAGLAMAAYGVRAQLPGFLCLVASAPVEKRLPLVPYSIGAIGVDGVGERSTSVQISGLLDQICAAADRHNLFLGVTAHAFNPDGMRGIDTIAYELAEQVPTATHVYVPTGGGGLLAAIARGLKQRAMPAKVIACQPSGCAPIVEFLQGTSMSPEVARCDSGISALQIPNPPDGRLAAEGAARSGGWGSMATDEEILAAQRLLAASEGIFVEPAAAAALACLIVDCDRGRVGGDDHPVLILSGAGWKDLGRFAADAERLPVVDHNEVSTYVDSWAADPRKVNVVGRAW